MLKTKLFAPVSYSLLVLSIVAVAWSLQTRRNPVIIELPEANKLTTQAANKTTQDIAAENRALDEKITALQQRLEGLQSQRDELEKPNHTTTSEDEKQLTLETPRTVTQSQLDANRLSVIANKYKPLLIAIGLEGDALEKILYEISQGTDRDSVNALLKSYLTPAEYQALDAERSRSENELVSKRLEVELSSTTPSLSTETAQKVIDAFNGNRQRGDLYSASAISRSNIDKQIDLTLDTINKTYAHLHATLPAEEMEKLQSFFREQELRYISLGKTMRDIEVVK